MRTTFLPSAEAGARACMSQLLFAIRQKPRAYRLPPDRVAEATLAFAAFEDACERTADPFNRTCLDTQHKRQTRAVAEKLCRELANLIRFNPAISEADRLEAGLCGRKAERRPAPRPEAAPLLWIPGTTPGQILVRFADPLHPESRAKPAGVRCLHLFFAEGMLEAPPAEPMHFVAALTRSPCRVSIAAEYCTLMLSFFAQWVSTRGEAGPMSSAAHMAPAPPARAWAA